MSEQRFSCNEKGTKTVVFEEVLPPQESNAKHETVPEEQ